MCVSVYVHLCAWACLCVSIYMCVCVCVMSAMCRCVCAMNVSVCIHMCDHVCVSHLCACVCLYDVCVCTRVCILKQTSVTITIQLSGLDKSKALSV